MFLGGGTMALAVYLAVAAPLSVLRVGQVLLAAGLSVLFWQSWRRLAQPPQSGDAEACTTFLRMRLIARRDAARGGWLWRVTPVVPAIAVILTGLAFPASEKWPSLTPVLVLVVVWLGVWLGLMLLIMRRQQAKVEAEIADLDRLTGGQPFASRTRGDGGKIGDEMD
jgi:hypothetical protein